MATSSLAVRESPISITQELSAGLKSLRFSAPVSHVYNPLEYAWEPHRLYLERYGRASREVLLLGMNPGPWGMAQTGIPFGEVAIVRDWMGLEAPVSRPHPEHARRRVEGFGCHRSEVSGARLWGWARQRYEEPQRFFKKFFVLNYCPLLFMDHEGRNLTPDKLPASERAPIIEQCDHALRRFVSYYKPRIVIGVGNFAQNRAREALKGRDVSVGVIPHPSPASPRANRGWAPQAEAFLKKFKVL